MTKRKREYNGGWSKEISLKGGTGREKVQSRLTRDKAIKLIQFLLNQCSFIPDTGTQVATQVILSPRRQLQLLVYTPASTPFDGASLNIFIGFCHRYVFFLQLITFTGLNPLQLILVHILSSMYKIHDDNNVCFIHLLIIASCLSSHTHTFVIQR